MESLGDPNYNRVLSSFNGMFDNTNECPLVDRRPLGRQVGECLQNAIDTLPYVRIFGLLSASLIP